MPLVGATTVAGLGGLLLLAVGDDGRINPENLPPDVLEAFKLQFPRIYDDGILATLTPETAQDYLKGWSGKLTELLVRDRLNAGEAIGGFRIPSGHSVSLASDPTQEGWDLIVEPSGQLFQVKATSSIAYIKETAEELDGSDISIITTDLPDFDVDSHVEILELSMSKNQIDELLEATLSDSVDDLDWTELLGWFGLLFSAGTAAILVKKAYGDYKRGVDLRQLYRSYGPSVVSRVISYASPIPFSGFFAAKYLRGRILVNEAVEVARERIARLDSLLSRLKSPGLTT